MDNKEKDMNKIERLKRSLQEALENRDNVIAKLEKGNS